MSFQHFCCTSQALHSLLCLRSGYEGFFIPSITLFPYLHFPPFFSSLSLSRFHFPSRPHIPFSFSTFSSRTFPTIKVEYLVFIEIIVRCILCNLYLSLFRFLLTFFLFPLFPLFSLGISFSFYTFSFQTFRTTKVEYLIELIVMSIFYLIFVSKFTFSFFSFLPYFPPNSYFPLFSFLFSIALNVFFTFFFRTLPTIIVECLVFIEIIVISIFA